MEEVAVRRARRSRLRDRIVFTGYRAGDEFVATLGLLSVKVFLRPGSDGSCRAVREAMAMRVPVIAARVGMLPEIVSDGVNGLLVPYRGAALADAILGLAREPERRERLAAGALASARERFDLDRQAERVERIYRKLLVGGAGYG
jgi:glycosyltransferase involved in cell wall biosynthesis